MNKRNRMGEAQHSAANAFVKREQDRLKSKAGHDPRMAAKYYEFDACMVNEGEHAQELARELTRGLDKEAFPVK